MRQLGQEAAQKAKDGMKKGAKATQTFSGKGKVEPAEKSVDKSAVIPPPIAVESSVEKHTVDTPALMQSPTSSAWKNEVNAKPVAARHSFEQTESLQSPTSTAWKSAAEHGSLSKLAASAARNEDNDDDEESEEEEEGEDEDEDEDEEDEDEDEDDEGEEEEDEEDEDDEDEDDEDGGNEAEVEKKQKE